MDKQTAVEVTTDVVEGAYDVAEDAIATIEEIPAIVKNNPIVLAGVAVISLAVGASVATFITKRHFKRYYEEIANLEIEQAKEFYKKEAKADIYGDPEAMAAKYDELPEATDNEVAETTARLVKSEGYSPNRVQYNQPTEVEVTREVVEVKESIRQNIFENYPSEFDAAAEYQKKLDGKPFIIEQDIFFANEEDRNEHALTFFAEDGVMADSQDLPVPNWERVIGEENLKFGYGTSDPKVVYVENVQHDGVYEITKSENSFAREVLGQEPEGQLKHADSRRRFRDRD